MATADFLPRTRLQNPDPRLLIVNGDGSLRLIVLCKMQLKWARMPGSLGLDSLGFEGMDGLDGLKRGTVACLDLSGPPPQSQACRWGRRSGQRHEGLPTGPSRIISGCISELGLVLTI